MRASTHPTCGICTLLETPTEHDQLYDGRATDADDDCDEAKPAFEIGDEIAGVYVDIYCNQRGCGRKDTEEPVNGMTGERSQVMASKRGTRYPTSQGRRAKKKSPLDQPNRRLFKAGECVGRKRGDESNCEGERRRDECDAYQYVQE